MTHPAKIGDTMPQAPHPPAARLADVARPDGREGAVALSIGDQVLTYAELDARIDAARGAYRDLGLEPGDRVVLLLPTSVEFIVAYFGAHRAGLVVIPLNPLLGQEEVAYILAGMQPALVVAAGAEAPFPVLGLLDGLLEQAGLRARLARYDGGSSFDLAMARAPAGLAPAPRADDDEVLILFTSGTSGKPKGASHAQAAIMANARHANAVFGLGPDDVLTCPLPLSHVFGQMVVMLGGLLAGAELNLVPRPAPAAVFAALTARRTTFLAAVPTTFAALAEMARQDPGAARAAGATLRTALAGGAPLPAATGAAFETAFGVPVHQGYGMTEVACCIALSAPPAPATGGVGPICAPLSARIIDAAGHEAEEGELELSGPNLFRGYYIDGQLQPRGDGDGFATGDIVRRDADGEIFLCDRKKELIIRNGYNVYPSEVEAVLADHPDVLLAAVIGVDDPVVGQEVAAFAALRENATASPAALAAWCRARIALYKYPRLVAILPTLPTNATGKIMKRALDPALLARVDTV
ncbi:acyl-CoA synthetase (AMP-forming)/AMP-acid ligase II [Caulobacter sp. AP07]|uniref:class I adenylate-forming enzyme family protein n=1 Tax=Caulobacter sp. AP07 TaxID=1144304 RepID=UPI000271DA4E|nr:AMP-binding protein [Caulobacter sp. AP07]EJL26605.1 acyl-CoA synthetase (AMP-forming)/AMP-acid ligase II [Caulobacter sp. AP07]